MNTKPEYVNFYERAAQKITGKPDYKMYSIHSLEGGMKVVIGPVSVFKRGPRKGECKYGPRSGCLEVLVTDEKVKNEQSLFSAETGLCYACCGFGQVSVGWSNARGILYEPCKKCTATGKANE